jgi:CDP-glucose 4,6-dehydratase
LIFHLAAQAIVSESYVEPLQTIQTNIFGVVRILEHLRVSTHKSTSVIITSDKCYKNTNKGIPFVENDELGGIDPYSASKASAEILINSYVNSFERLRNFHGVASCRAGNVFGGGDWSENRLVPDLLKNLFATGEVFLRMPNATRPWTHVFDILNGYLILGERLHSSAEKYSGSWNFASEEHLTVENIAEIVIEKMGFGKIRINELNSIGYEATLLSLNPKKAKLELNWHCKVATAQALADCVTWYREQNSGVEMKYYSETYARNFLAN